MKKYRIKRGKAYLGRVELKEQYHPCHWVELATEALLMDKHNAMKVINHFKDNKMELETIEITKPKKQKRTLSQVSKEYEKYLEYDTGEFGR